jgi:hypothetical protein
MVDVHKDPEEGRAVEPVEPKKKATPKKKPAKPKEE